MTTTEYQGYRSRRVFLLLLLENLKEGKSLPPGYTVESINKELEDLHILLRKEVR